MATYILKPGAKYRGLPAGSRVEFNDHQARSFRDLIVPADGSPIPGMDPATAAFNAALAQAKAEQAKAEQAKAEQAKAEQAKAEQAKAEQAKK